MSKINFKAWTDAQLNAARHFTDSPEWSNLDAEIKRREAAGKWLKDGSTERVARLIASNSKPKRRRKP